MQDKSNMERGKCKMFVKGEQKGKQCAWGALVGRHFPL
jgi:hypothetical protein